MTIGQFFCREGLDSRGPKVEAPEQRSFTRKTGFLPLGKLLFRKETLRHLDRVIRQLRN